MKWVRKWQDKVFINIYRCIYCVAGEFESVLSLKSNKSRFFLPFVILFISTPYSTIKMGKTERQYKFKSEWFEEEKKGDISAFECLLFNALLQLRPIGMLHSSSNKHTEKASTRFFLKRIKLNYKKSANWIHLNCCATFKWKRSLQNRIVIVS